MKEEGIGLQRLLGSLGGARRKELVASGFVGDEVEWFNWWPCGVFWEEERVGGAAPVVIAGFTREYEVAAVVWSVSSDGVVCIVSGGRDRRGREEHDISINLSILN
ncbi:hypothetical protein HAX54_033518 [Datura stramonium]|uniref:Uncharacterized protein n=1 Tax=Datura stramonium TaxID=4076 RepID=A0ABS8RM21_DATST|nr:hypothetical protein [Datura stramonium]